MVQALYCPEAHAWHVLPADGWYLPMSQSVHTAEPTAANCPVVHDVQFAALYEVLNVPPMHTRHPMDTPAKN
jgi:hypothetical protein